MKNFISLILLFYALNLFATENLTFEIKGQGNETVIFENGLGDTLSTWQRVVPAVSSFAKTFTYNRMPSGNVLTAQEVVDSLQRLIKQERLDPPFILVGHSLGGLYLLLFAAEYPQEVKGVVLVDSMSPWQTMVDPLPPTSAPYYREAKGIKISQKQVLKAAKFPTVPLIVISATKHIIANNQYASHAQEVGWAAWQNQLAMLSPLSQHVTIDTLHDIQNYAPWLVTAAIKDITDS